MLGRGNKDGGRTPQDRAAAAAERARRRGTAPPPMHSVEPPPPVEEPEPAVAYEPEPEPVHEAPPEPEPAYEAPQSEPQYEALEPAPQYGAPSPEPAYEAPPEPEPTRVHEAPEPPYEVPEPEPQYEAPSPEPAYEAPESEAAYEAPDPEPHDEAPPEPGPMRVHETPEPRHQAPPEPEPELHAPPPPPPPPEPDPVDLGPLTQPRRIAPPSGRIPDRPRAAPPLQGGQRTAKLRRRGPEGPPRGARAPRRRPVKGPRSASFHRRRILAGIVVLAVLAFLWLVNKTFQFTHGDPTGVVRVTIPEGADVGSIGDLLAERKVIDSSGFFSLNATLTGRRGELQPGQYTLQRDMTYGDVLSALEKGPAAAPTPATFKLTLPEGLSIRELSGRIEDGGIEGDYVEAAGSRSALRRARELGLPRGGETTEGFLFPATYDLVDGASAEQLVAQQLNAYADNAAGIDYRFAKRKNLTKYDVLIIASMVEREAQLDEERPKVASVIYNRLKAGMPLAIDATIRYAENNWTKPLLQSELDRPGPYNTRLNRSLPPTPIGNPGLASLEAAAHPANTDFLYYVVKPCGEGAHNFSSTDAEFQADVAAYNAARDRAGGQSPTSC